MNLAAFVCMIYWLRKSVTRLVLVEPFTRGAYGSFNPPGVLTSLAPQAVGPVGQLHFAGADTSAEWPGYMDGAIRTGERKIVSACFSSNTPMIAPGTDATIRKNSRRRGICRPSASDMPISSQSRQ